MTPPTHRFFVRHRSNRKRYILRRFLPCRIRYLIGGVMTPPYIGSYVNYSFPYFHR